MICNCYRPDHNCEKCRAGGTYFSQEVAVPEPEPAFLVPPGKILSNELKARGISKREFASMTGIPSGVLRRLFKGNEPLTMLMAFKIGVALPGITGSFWLRCERTYRKRKRRLDGIKTKNIHAR